MIKVKSKKSHKLFITAIIAVAAVAGAIGVFVITRESPRDTASQKIESPATKEQQEQGKIIKESSIQKDGSSGSDTPPAPKPNSESGKATVEVSITAANKIDSFYMIRSIISVVDDKGACTLTLSKAGYNTVTKTAGVQPQASVSSCKGFNVDINEIPASGDWELNIAYSSNTYEGSASKIITVEK